MDGWARPDSLKENRMNTSHMIACAVAFLAGNFLIVHGEHYYDREVDLGALLAANAIIVAVIVLLTVSGF